MTNPPGARALLDTLDGDLATRHTEIMLALNALLDALGAPPPGPGTTLADVQTTLLATNVLLTSDLATISQQLQQIYDLLANSIAPNVENVFYALNDLYTLMAAPDSPRLPELISIVDLPSESELLHCQRVQWMIDEFFGQWMGDVALHLTAVQGVGIALALAALVVATGGIGAIPLAMLSGASAAIIQVEDLSALSDDATIAVKAALRQALYGAQNASAGATAWHATIDTLVGLNPAVALAWHRLIWADWFNHLYDAANHNSTTEPGSWDLSGYDGAICAPIVDDGCYEGTSVSGGFGRQYIGWWHPGAITSDNDGANNIVGDGNALICDPYGMTIENTGTTHIRFYVYIAGPTYTVWIAPGATATVTHTGATRIVCDSSSGYGTDGSTFTYRYCLPPQ